MHPFIPSELREEGGGQQFLTAHAKIFFSPYKNSDNEEGGGGSKKSNKALT